MMVLHRDTGVIEHRHIADIVDYLTPNDLLVVNDTKVFPARLLGEWPDTHGAVEVLMVNAAPMDADDERPSMTAAAVVRTASPPNARGAMRRITYSWSPEPQTFPRKSSVELAAGSVR